MAPNDRLKKWIDDAKIADAEAARRVNYDRSNFHRLLRGRLKPSMELAAAIETLTEGEIPIGAWVGFVPQPATTQSEAA